MTTSSEETVRRYEYDADNEHMTPELHGTVSMVLASAYDALAAERDQLVSAINDAIRGADAYGVRVLQGHLDGSPATPDLRSSIGQTVHRMFVLLAARKMDNEALLSERDRLRQRVEAMQAVVNAASVWQNALVNEDAPDEDHEECELKLEEAVRAYRLALSGEK